MPAENENGAGQRRLTSWKEIAAYVGRDERTAKRWEATRGLPVRRVPGAVHGSVFAYADEIEAWLRGRDVPRGDESPTSSTAMKAPAWPLRRRVGTGALIAGAALCFGVLVWLGQKQVSTAPAALLRTHNPAAASLYLAGLHAWQTRTPSGLHRAITNFNQAIARDPRFADAWVGLADTYNLEGEFTDAPRDRDYAKAADAARQAIVLDPSLAGAHAALAFSEFYGARDVPAAEREFRRALALDPQSAVAHHWYATFLMTVGNSGAALSEIGRAESLDAESTAIPADKALILFHAGRTGEAVRLLRQVEEDNPEFAAPHKYLASIAFAQGDGPTYVRESKAAALKRRDKTDSAVADAAAQGLAKGGREGMLLALFAVRRQLFARNQATAYSIAATCAELHDEGCARSYLAASVARHEPDSVALLIDPSFAQFRKTGWFHALLAEAGLPYDLPGSRRNL